jgi:hypothetical protein
MKTKNPKQADLDPNIRTLVKALNAFDGVQTIGSCGGHKNPSPAQWGKGTFYVKFELEWTTEGRFALEFLAWFFSDYCQRSDVSGFVRLMPVAAPPFLNAPGECLYFVVEGFNEADPELIGSRLNRLRKEAFIAPEAVTEKRRTS